MNELQKRSVVIFDFDGTLADTTSSILATARKVLTEYGMTEGDMGDLRRLIGPPFPQGYVEIFGIPMSDAIRLTERYREIYATLGPETHLFYKGMVDVLDNLRAHGKRLAIASSKMDYQILPMLDDNHVSHMFEYVSAQHDSDHADKPYLIGRVLQELGVNPCDAVMVGDRKYDILGAKALGIPCVAVLFGTAERRELDEAGAAAIAATPAELNDILIGGLL